MENLLLENQKNITQTDTHFKRYLFNSIDLSNRLISITGARGTGKTKLLLQIAKIKLADKKTLYISLDHIYFSANSLFDLAKKFVQFGGTHLLLDETHKYPNWSKEIKFIHDSFPNLCIIFAASSILNKHISEDDLCRKTKSYNLKEMSFREFIESETNQLLPFYSLLNILQNHVSIARELIQKIRPIPLFEKYLKCGAYPHRLANEEFDYQKLLNAINFAIENDINAVENVNYTTIIKLKILLKNIAENVPFTPNISDLSQLVGLSRNSVVTALKMLERAGLINELYRPTTEIGLLTKPEKLYLNNASILYALAKENTSNESVRETFIINQLKGLHKIQLHQKGDLIIDERIPLEIAEKRKPKNRNQNSITGFVTEDQIEIGSDNIIPVWLFGFLY
ncbi:MAG: AAA family ATPase [Brumimicrobium sp.]